MVAGFGLDAESLSRAGRDAKPAPFRHRAPEVNLFDIPELMPGAQPSANPAQREDFEQRCRLLHEEQRLEELEVPSLLAKQAGVTIVVQDLQAMFPMLDTDLVYALYTDARTPQHALDTLLELAAAFAEPVPAGDWPPSPPPRDVGVHDHDRFPSLCTADGWQVANQRAFDREQEELGTEWCDRAKEAANLPAPMTKPRTLFSAWSVDATAAHRSNHRRRTVDDACIDLSETEYELRHRVGQERARRRSQHARVSDPGRSRYLWGALRKSSSDTGERFAPGFFGDAAADED